ncbi:toll/interleukin-1 receptor domain-containing protein [Polyangium sp. y55x31]|uniref:TIR domain-containing protein n=1 Tax=Polyangium sp. y55x31 TaxID=3042688 RepID=UPI0024824CC1|nr:toll/interleukin-1 receptor domain-containing protein [Polyangium sp. y55x31]MDI1484829.1 toll/interleukin-1 receptor domain-containing protein [Polyangium sp. y55x31]
MMRKGVNEHDRVVLVCSKASLDRKGVLNEIEETLAREAREGGETYLIPIRLDDYVFTGWRPKREDIAQAIRDRVVADFEGADADPAKFDRALSQLLRALRIKGGPPATSGGAGP